MSDQILQQTCTLLTLQVTEIVSKIKAKSELDCRARDIITIEDGDLDFGAALDKFVSILKGDPGCNKIKGQPQVTINFIPLAV